MNWRRTVIRLSLDLLHVTGSYRLFPGRSAGLGGIFMLHRVRPAERAAFRPNAHLEVEPRFLAEVVERLRASGRDIVSLDEALRRLAEPDGARRFAVLTFDDGYHDNFAHALPVLKAAEAPFTVYVTTGFIDRTITAWWLVLEAVCRKAASVGLVLKGVRRDYDCSTIAAKRTTFATLEGVLKNLPEEEKDAAVRALADGAGLEIPGILAAESMGWDEVRALQAEPLATVGAHTVSHPALSRVGPARLVQELGGSADRLAEMTGVRPRHFAYPYGDAASVGPREHAAAAAGYSSAVTTRHGVLAGGENRFDLPRLSLNGGFQSMRYVDLFLSGVPSALANRVARLRGT